MGPTIAKLLKCRNTEIAYKILVLRFDKILLAVS